LAGGEKSINMPWLGLLSLSVVYENPHKNRKISKTPTNMMKKNLKNPKKNIQNPTKKQIQNLKKNKQK
jgi:hypothetical protein